MVSATESLSSARRLVVKVGSSLIIDASSGGVPQAWLDSLADDVAALRKDGRQVIVVSSGAVALGRKRLGTRPSARLDEKQAAAAAGQTLLMQAWDQAFSRHGIATAQLLLTLDDTERRRRWLNARATIQTLLTHKAVPVINENDSVATDELRYGDNDRLSARAAQMVQSDLLILLSDVDGLYTADPAREPAASHLPYVPAVDARIEEHAGGTAAGGVGTGGMRTKVAAARIATEAGCATIIASGREPNPLARLAEGARATLFAPVGTPARAYKQWIAGTLAPAGRIAVDAGAESALSSGRSLLPAGATAVEGEFERGSCLAVLGPSGSEIGRGISAYSSAEARMIIGVPSSAIEDRLGYSGPDELIHRDDLVMLAR